MMKKILFCTLILISCLDTYALELGLGLRDNQFLRIDFVGKLSKKQHHSYVIGFEQSLLNVLMKEQCGRLFTGYMINSGNWTIDGFMYGGTEYAETWQMAGILLNGSNRWNRLATEATINLNYDTKLGVQINYEVESSVSVWTKTYGPLGLQQLDVCASFGNLPEYRDNIYNLRVGLKFTSGNLWVLPEICVPGVGDKYKTNDRIRVLCSMGWILNLRKSK